MIGDGRCTYDDGGSYCYTHDAYINRDGSCPMRSGDGSRPAPEVQWRDRRPAVCYAGTCGHRSHDGIPNPRVAAVTDGRPITCEPDVSGACVTDHVAEDAAHAAAAAPTDCRGTGLPTADGACAVCGRTVAAVPAAYFGGGPAVTPVHAGRTFADYLAAYPDAGADAINAQLRADAADGPNVGQYAAAAGLRSYDSAYPVDWADDVARVTGRRPVFAFVWSYDGAGAFGRPYPLTAEAAAQLAEYERSTPAERYALELAALAARKDGTR